MIINYIGMIRIIVNIIEIQNSNREEQAVSLVFQNSNLKGDQSMISHNGYDKYIQPHHHYREYYQIQD